MFRFYLDSFFSGDALASPTHWYYGGLPQIKTDYGPAGITDYTKPTMELKGSIMNKSDMNGGGRSSSSSGSGRSWLNKRKQHADISIIGGVINHGKEDYWSPNKSIHYHATLQRGENTLEAQLARALMKSIVKSRGKFKANDWRVAYVQFMTNPASHNDTYASTCHRMFFANMFFHSKPAEDCPDNDGHNVDTIDGLVLPTIAALATASDPDSTLEEVEKAAAECAAVTRKSSKLEQACQSWGRLVSTALRADTEDQVVQELNHCAQRFGLRELPRPDGPDTMTACYLSQSVPSLFNMIAKYLPGQDVWKALLANANVGGESVHRGSILGAVLGARAGDSVLPSRLKDGLYHKSDLEQEIDDFVKAVLKDNNNDDGRTESSKSEPEVIEL